MEKELEIIKNYLEYISPKNIEANFSISGSNDSLIISSKDITFEIFIEIKLNKNETGNIKDRTFNISYIWTREGRRELLNENINFFEINYFFERFEKLNLKEYLINWAKKNSPLYKDYIEKNKKECEIKIFEKNLKKINDLLIYMIDIVQIYDSEGKYLNNSIKSEFEDLKKWLENFNVKEFIKKLKIEADKEKKLDTIKVFEKIKDGKIRVQTLSDFIDAFNRFHY